MKPQKIKPSFIRKDKRGIFVEAVNGSSWKSISFGNMKKGAIMGNHYHKKTLVLFFIISGKVRVDTISIKTKEKSSFEINKNEGYLFEPNCSHAINFLENSTFLMAKSLAYNAKDDDTFVYKVPQIN